MLAHLTVRNKIFNMNDLRLHQVEMVCLEDLVPTNHRYRLFKKVINLKEVDEILSTRTNSKASKYCLSQLFRCMLLQIIEDYSYLELEGVLQDSAAARWFCGFALREVTPDYRELKSIRRKLGVSLVIKLFASLQDQLREKGYQEDLLGNVNLNSLINRNSSWSKRDKVIVNKLALQNKLN